MTGAAALYPRPVIVRGELLPDEPEVAGLLALLLLTESRRASRTRPDGSLVLLGEQDRTRWDRAMIAEGQTILRRCLGRNHPGAYQLQAAINAVYADALQVEQTDWPQIVALYDQLLAVAPTPVVALNRAIAIGEVQGPAVALALVDELDLDTYYPSTPRVPICSAGWAGTARPRPPTSAPPPWRQPMPSRLPQARWPSVTRSGPVTSNT